MFLMCRSMADFKRYETCGEATVYPIIVTADSGVAGGNAFTMLSLRSVRHRIDHDNPRCTLPKPLADGSNWKHTCRCIRLHAHHVQHGSALPRGTPWARSRQFT